MQTRELVLPIFVTGGCAAVGLIVARSGMSVPRRIMTLDLSALWRVLDDRLPVVLLFSALLTVGCLVAAKNGAIVPLMVVGLIAVSSTLLNHHHLREVGAIADGQVTTAELVPSQTGCLSHDSDVKRYALWLYRLELSGIEHRRVDLSSGSQLCGEYVVATVDALEGCEGGELLAMEPRASWGLWRYPSRGCD